MQDIYIVGLGMEGLLQLTAETNQVLAISAHTFLLHPEPEQILPYIVQFKAHVTDLRDHYRTGIARLQMYSDIADAILSSAKVSRPVVLATYGHPAFLVTTESLLRQRGLAEGLSVQTLPSVSSLDCAIIDLGIDVAEGITCVFAPEMLRKRQFLTPTLHALIFEAAAAGTSEVPFDPLNEGGSIQLLEHLSLFYPKLHPMVLLFCRMNPLLRAEITRATVADLPSLRRKIHAGVTLYLPPLVAQGITSEGE